MVWFGGLHDKFVNEKLWPRGIFQMRMTKCFPSIIYMFNMRARASKKLCKQIHNMMENDFYQS